MPAEGVFQLFMLWNVFDGFGESERTEKKDWEQDGFWIHALDCIGELIALARRALVQARTGCPHSFK